MLENLINIILISGKSAVDLALYVLLPVMVIMMAFMKLMEARGVLHMVAKLVSPVFNRFGIPGLGVFAALQLLFVSFAAPLATLRIMEQDQTGKRAVAATLAMVFTMSQANVVFPMISVGLDVGTVILTSIVGGLFAAVLTYYLFSRSLGDSLKSESIPFEADRKTSLFNLLISGGQEAVEVVIKSLPIILIAIFFVNIIKAVGVIQYIEILVTPIFDLFGLSSYAVLPIVTKFMAGGTAMLGVTMELINDGVLSVNELNRLAGFMINPLDLVGVAVLVSAGPKVASIAKPAVMGAICGVMLRALLHLILY